MEVKVKKDIWFKYENNTLSLKVGSGEYRSWMNISSNDFDALCSILDYREKTLAEHARAIVDVQELLDTLKCIGNLVTDHLIGIKNTIVKFFHREQESILEKKLQDVYKALDA
jgi:hypothetical protein